jgi:hypothetical protein
LSASIAEFYTSRPRTSRRYFAEQILTNVESVPEGEEKARPSASGRLYRHWVEEWGPEACFLLVTTGAGLWAAGRWINPVSDPGFTWSLAYRLSKGERLYRDIFLAYTPLSPYLLAAAARLFGLSARFVVLVNWIPAVVAGFLLLRVGRPLLSAIERLALVALVLSFSLFVPGDGRLILPYYPGVVHAFVFSIGALLLLQRDGERFGWRSLPAGFLAGLAFCCKQEVGLAAFLALSASVTTRPRRALPWIGRLLAGFCLAVLPAAVFIFTSAPVQSLRYDSHLWPLAPAPPAAISHLMRIVTGLNYPNWPVTLRAAVFQLLWQIACLGLLALLLARERKRSVWLRVLSVFAGLGLWWILEGFSFFSQMPPVSLSMSVAFFAALLALFTPHLPGREFVVAIGVFAGVVGMRTAFSPLLSGHYDGPGHFASALTWVLFLCILAPRLLLGETRSASSFRVLMALLLLMVRGWQAASGAENLRFAWRVAVDTAQGRVFVERPQVRLFEAIRRHSLPGERVLVIPETNAVDVLFRLENVSPLVDMLPGLLDTRAERALIERLEKSPPDLVILFERSVAEYGVRPFGQGYGLLLADWCNRNYRVVESTAAGKVMRLRGPPSAAGDPPGRRAAIYNFAP